MTPRTRGLLLSGVTAGLGWAVLTVVLAGLVVALVPVGVLVGAFTWSRLRRRPDRALAWLVVVACTPLAWVLWLVGSRYATAWSEAVHGDRGQMFCVAVWGLFAGPALGAIWWRIEQAWREAQPMPGPVEAKRREETEAARRRVVTHKVQETAHGAESGQDKGSAFRPAAKLVAVPLRTAQGPILGQVLAGDLDWPCARRMHLWRDLLVLPREKTHHVVVLGASGSGKSEIVFRIVESDLEAGRQVIYINCKQGMPGEEPSLRLTEFALAAGKSVQTLIREVSSWDPMRGTTDQVRERLLATQVWADEYWEHASDVLLGLALDLNAQRGTAVKSLPDLVWELVRGRLEKLAQSDPQAADLVKMMEDRTVAGAVLRWASQALQLRGWIAPAEAGGWGWEDKDLSIVDLPTSTEPGAARALLRAMLTDLDQWMSDPVRRPLGKNGKRRELTVIIEEVSALDDDPILARRVVNMVERFRSGNGKAVLVAQDPLGLGDDRAQTALLTNGVLITGQQSATDVVEKLIGLAGTQERVEASAAYEGRIGHRIGTEGSARVQETYRVSPNLLRSLAVGEVIVIYKRQWAHLAVAMSASGYKTPTGEVIDQMRHQLQTVRDTRIPLPKAAEAAIAAPEEKAKPRLQVEQQEDWTWLGRAPKPEPKKEHE